MKRKPTNLSLNMLIAFEAVCRLKSATKAASELNIAQPAISRHLKKFEEITGYDLFVRTLNGLEPTAKGVELWEDVTEILDLSEKLVLGNNSIFNPLNETHSFKIGMAWLDTKKFVKDIVLYIHSIYPLIQINAIHVREEDAFKKLKDKDIDLYLGAKNRDMPSMISFQDLIDTHFCVLCSDKSPLFRHGNISKEEFINASHLKVYFGSSDTLLDRELQRKNIIQKSIIEAPDMENLLLILRETDNLFVSTEERAKTLCRTNGFLRKLEPEGFGLPNIKLCQMWNNSNTASTAHQWLRSIISERFV